MNLLDLARGALFGIRAVLSEQKAKSAGSDWADYMFRTGLDQMGGGAERISRPYAQHPTVYRAIKALAMNVARTPLELFRKGSDDVVEGSAVETLLDRPNPLMRGSQLMEATVIDLEAFGNALWWLGPSARMSGGLTLPVSIRRLDPCRTTIKLGERDEPVRYDYRTKGQQLAIPADQVIHYKHWNPYDEAWGMSWTDPARGEFDTDWAAQRWNRLFFVNGAEPGGVLQPAKDSIVTETAAERIRTQWLNRHRGLGNAHGPMITPSGLEYVKTGIGQREMEFGDLRRYSRENTLSPSGVPPAIAGIMEYANYANMTPQLRLFFHLDLFPLMKYIERVYQTDFLDRYRVPMDAYFKLEDVAALIDDTKDRVEVGAKLWSMGVPLEVINDRLELGLDLDGVDGADVPWVPFNVAPAGMASEPPEPKPAAKPEGQDTEEDDGTDDIEEDQPDPNRGFVRSTSVRFFTKRGTRGRLTAEQREARWRALDKTIRDLELKAESRWRTYLKHLEKEVLRNIHGPVTASLGRRKEIVDPEHMLFDEANADQEAILELEPVWRAAIARGVDTLAGETGLAIDFNFFDPAVTSALTRRRILIRGVNDRLAADLRETLGEGIALGETEQELSKRVLNTFAGERANARTIARTETFSAFSEGRFLAMNQAGIQRQVWLAAGDDRVRDSHVDVDGDEIAVGDTFDNGLRYPHDPAGDPSEVINCRCVAVPA